jgi:hypothetical protein
VQYVFMELLKYSSGDDPQGTIDRWAYFGLSSGPR